MDVILLVIAAMVSLSCMASMMASEIRDYRIRASVKQQQDASDQAKRMAQR